MLQQRCVIIGGSHAAAQTAIQLRKDGWQGSIEMISAEGFYPYHHPPLSKDFLSAESSLDELLLRPENFYSQHKIDIRLNTRVRLIDSTNKSVTLDNDINLDYDYLVICTGAIPRVLNIPGSQLSGVFYLRTATDALKIKAQIKKAKNAVIIGGGYIGLETAASLKKQGLNVTVLELETRLLQRVTAPEVSAFYQRVHQEEGVTILTSVSAVEITGSEHVSGVKLNDGNFLNADLVIVGIGVIPETTLAAEAGLHLTNGIQVDEHCRTSNEHIFAAGDCSCHFNKLYDRWLRLESIQNANEQAMTISGAICAVERAYSPLPSFWSDQFDLKLQIAGISLGHDQVIFRGSPDEGRSFSAIYMKNNQILAIDAINRPKDFMMVKRAIQQRKSININFLNNQEIDIKEALEL